MGTTKTTETTKDLSYQIIGCAIEVHRLLGPGLLESPYEQCLAYEFTQAGLTFAMQTPIPIKYKGVSLDCGYRLDFIVEDQLIIELKAVTQLLPIHSAQLLTYLKLSQLTLGLLINFNTTPLHHGIRRFRI